MLSSPEQLSADINRISAYLALDDFEGSEPGPKIVSRLDAVVLLGNQVVTTLTAACTLLLRAPSAILLLSGGAGHSTPLLYENLRNSAYGVLVDRGLILETMAEAEMGAVVAQLGFRIPPGRIRVEDQSRNSAENARMSIEILQDARPEQGPVLILQDPTMQRRSILTWGREAEGAGSEAPILSHAIFVPKVEPAPDGSLGFVGLQAQGAWTMERFLGLILGEIRRLYDNEEGYGPRGRNFLPHVEIPAPVYESYLRVSERCGEAQAIR
jgi:uncharacterized SAM-binding protein YcdF (DUF218 family)